MRSRNWAAGGAILVLALMLLVWSALVDVAVKVTGRGILLPPGGVVDIVAEGNQTEVRQQLSLAAGQAEDARRHFAWLTAFHVREEVPRTLA